MFMLVVLFIASAWSCDCYFENGDQLSVLGKVSNVERCKGLILESLYHEYKNSNQCPGPLEIQWTCGKEKEKKVFECKTFETMLDAEKTFVATTAAGAVLSKDIDVKSVDDCNTGPKDEMKEVPNAVSFSVGSKEEMHKVLSEIDPKYPGDIFDSIDNYSMAVSLVNDNNIVKEAITNVNTSNDLANTHGYNYVVQKRLDGQGYLVEVSWNSQLYTSYTNPLNPNYSWPNGITHVGQNFIEENLAKIMLKKVKDGDKVFWSVGGGIHELNKDDLDRHALFSGVSQQRTFHEWINGQQFQDNGQTIKVKVYDNVPQEGSELRGFVEGNIGKRLTLGPLSGKKIRTYVELDAGARVTGVKDAGLATVGASINMDAWLWGKSAVRLSAGNRTNVYVTGETSNDRFYDVMIGSKKVQVGYRYSENDRKLASYQNPLPQDYADRDRDVPNRNNTHMLMLKISW